MSDIEEESNEFFGFYGKPLELFDDESAPKKKPIAIEDQVAKDAQGRRRFHGAFTGGFSAGFFNTVGSLEGWQPSEFKSSRAEKASGKIQKPEDYMDDEDIGEFGIAPQKVKATDDYNTSKKRKKQVFADGPIPGDPVLHSLIECGNDTIGYLLLRNIGYKHVAVEDEDNDDVDNDVNGEAEQRKVYGCEMPKVLNITPCLDIVNCDIPEIYKNALKEPKANTFGMGYTGLDRSSINLFTSSKLVVNERNNKKLSISGQAFGVGAFEEDDDDIYLKEDLSKYDFELTSEKVNEKKKSSEKLLLGMFVKSKESYKMTEKFPPPIIPQTFSGIHKVRKSRFEPVISKEEETVPKRYQVDARTRAILLNDTETPDVSHRIAAATTSSKPGKSNLGNSSQPKPNESKFKLEPPTNSGLIFDKFVSSSSKLEEIGETITQNVVESAECAFGTKEMREAVKMKLFGPLTRTTESWLPNSLLCKRFNVPEPTFSDDIKVPKQRKKNLIFMNSQFEEKKCEFTENPAGLQTRSVDPEPTTSEIIITDTPEITITPQKSIDNVDNAPKEINSSTAAKETEPPPIDPTEKIDIQKNVDLFKAVFLDSESETEEENQGTKPNETNLNKDLEETKKREEELKIKVLSDDLLLPRINPMKRGILSNMEAVISDNRKEEETKPQLTKETIESDFSSNSYGPKLPNVSVPNNTSVTKNHIDMSDDADEWVEKRDSDADLKMKKSHKHKRKRKKEKHKSKQRNR